MGIQSISPRSGSSHRVNQHGMMLAIEPLAKYLETEIFRPSLGRRTSPPIVRRKFPHINLAKHPLRQPEYHTPGLDRSLVPATGLPGLADGSSDQPCAAIPLCAKSGDSAGNPRL
jgi:hypothetical protein